MEYLNRELIARRLDAKHMSTTRQKRAARRGSSATKALATTPRALRLREQGTIRALPPDDRWGVQFARLLREALGPNDYWDELVFRDWSHTEAQLVSIRSSAETRRDPLRGTVAGFLAIDVSYNRPALGFAEEGAADDWSEAGCGTRNERIRFMPLDEIRGVLTGGDGPVPRFTAFPAWSHSAHAVGMPHLAHQGHISVYHDDFNTSYPAVAVVALAIREHYRRVRSV
jgi:hypothetical protein